MSHVFSFSSYPEPVSVCMLVEPDGHYNKLIYTHTHISLAVLKRGWL